MQKNLQKEFLTKIENKEPLKIDLQNEVYLDLNFDNQINAYRGYWKEENIGVGIWKIETLYKIVTGEIDNVQLVEN